VLEKVPTGDQEGGLHDTSAILARRVVVAHQLEEKKRIKTSPHRSKEGGNLNGTSAFELVGGKRKPHPAGTGGKGERGKLDKATKPQQQAENNLNSGS